MVIAAFGLYGFNNYGAYIILIIFKRFFYLRDRQCLAAQQILMVSIRIREVHMRERNPRPVEFGKPFGFNRLGIGKA